MLRFYIPTECFGRNKVCTQSNQNFIENLAQRDVRVCVSICKQKSCLFNASRLFKTIYIVMFCGKMNETRNNLVNTKFK